MVDMIQRGATGVAEGPAVGDLAPDADLLGPDGRAVTLATYWAERPVVLIFLRYFGCPFCQMQVAELIRDEQRFRAADAQVVLVGHGHPGAGSAFAAKKRIPFPLLMDPWRDAYRAYGLDEGSFGQVYGPKVLPQTLRRGLSKGTRQGLPQGGNMRQLPGTFVIDTGGVVRHEPGVVRMAHRAAHAADAPSNAEIFEVLAPLGRA